jgi:hypothetical protein
MQCPSEVAVNDRPPELSAEECLLDGVAGMSFTAPQVFPTTAAFRHSRFLECQTFVSTGAFGSFCLSGAVGMTHCLLELPGGEWHWNMRQKRPLVLVSELSSVACFDRLTVPSVAFIRTRLAAT